MISVQYATSIVVACTLMLTFSLPAESNPCEKNTVSQPPATVKVKASEVSEAKLSGTSLSEPEKSKVKTASKPVQSVTVASVPSKIEVKTEDAVVKPVEQADSGKDGAKSDQEATINMEVLTKRLKDTKAIGLFTKLAIRNDVTDLVDNVKRYRKKSLLATKIKEIRESFEGLLMKIVALLEEDPELSRDLYVGRESIWKSLLEVKA